MGVNLVVKPVATYAGVDDNNGGGYVDGYDATYANFCLSTGAKFDNDDVIAYGDFSYTSIGVYGFTTGLGSGFTAIPEGVICRCVLDHDASGTTMIFHAFLTKEKNPTGTLNYLPTGDSSSVDLSTLDFAMQNLSAPDTLTITYGGALATIEAGANLAKTHGYTLMTQGPGTYVRTAGVTGITNLVVTGVDSAGNIAEGDARPLEDLHTNAVQYGWRHSSGVITSILLVATRHILYASVAVSSLIKRDDGYNHVLNTNGITVTANETNNAWLDYGAAVYTTQYGNNYNGEFLELYGLAYTGTSRPIGNYYNCIIDVYRVCDGVITPGAGNFYNCIIICVELYRAGLRADPSIFSMCAIIAKDNTTAIVHLDTYSFNVLFHSCILIGWTQVIDTVPAGSYVMDCGFYGVDSVGDDLNEKWQNNIELSADPFIDSANGDYRLDPDGPDFAKLYDSTVGRVLIGATGPELTTGGGGGVTYPVLFTSDGGVLYAD